MNIWLLRTSEPMPVVDPDGRLMRMGMLAEELSNRGHNVTWFSSTFNHFTKTQSFNKDTIVKVKDNYYLDLSYARGYKKNISVSRILHQITIARKFKKKTKKLQKPDLIYVSYPIIEYAEKAVKYGKKYNIPVIVDIRDLWPDIFNHNLPKWKRIIATPYIKNMGYKAKKIMKNAFAINAVSEAVLLWGLEKAERKRTKFDRYFYIGYNKPIEIEKIKDYNEIDKNKFNIVFLGTINNQFNYKIIAEIANKLESEDKDINILICGDGPQISTLRELVGNISNVKLLGWIGKEEINYVLENSKIGLAPYKNTFDFRAGVSNKFAEYISYGLPIVLTSGGYMKSLLEKNDCGVSSQNIEEICQYILKLKNDNNRYKQVSENAEKLYENNFMAKKIYKSLADYLEKIKGEI